MHSLNLTQDEFEEPLDLEDMARHRRIDRGVGQGEGQLDEGRKRELVVGDDDELDEDEWDMAEGGMRMRGGREEWELAAEVDRPFLTATAIFSRGLSELVAGKRSVA